MHTVGKDEVSAQNGVKAEHDIGSGPSIASNSSVDGRASLLPESALLSLLFPETHTQRTAAAQSHNHLP